MPEHHKDALEYHAKAMKKALKSMGVEETKAEPEDTPVVEDKDLENDGVHAEKAEDGKDDAEETKALFADLRRDMLDLKNVKRRTLERNGKK